MRFTFLVLPLSLSLAACGTTQQAANDVGNATDVAGDSLSNLADQAGDTIGNAGDAVGNTLANTTEDIGKRADRIGAAIHNETR